MRICDLKQKEVINIHTCRSLGCPLDVEFCWCFSRESECIIPWDCIRQIGEDIILVDFRDEKRLGGD